MLKLVTWVVAWMLIIQATAFAQGPLPEPEDFPMPGNLRAFPRPRRFRNLQNWHPLNFQLQTKVTDDAGPSNQTTLDGPKTILQGRDEVHRPPTQENTLSAPSDVSVKSGSLKPKSTSGSKSKSKARGDAPCLAWVKPEVPSQAVLLCVHGLGLYSGSWEQFGQKMSMLGFPSYAIDVRGFGSWMKAKGHQKVNFKACLNDVKTTLEAVRAANPGLPVWLMGESMGGAIALQSAALYPSLVDGLISSVPAGDRFQQKKTDLKVALHMLAGPNRPFNVGTGIIDQATKNPQLRKEWEDDPLDRLKLSPRELLQFQTFMNQNHERAKEIKKAPVLIVQGAEDKLVKPEGTVEVFNELATPDKALKVIANAEHLIFEEGQFDDETLRLVVDWIENHLPESGLWREKGPALELISQGRILLANKDYSEACRVLEQAVQIVPRSGEAHLLLGMAYLHHHRFFKAREHLRKAIRFGHGSFHARRANQVLMLMQPQFLIPEHTNKLYGPPHRGPHRSNTNSKMATRQPNLDGARPSVLIFCACWCEPCQNMEKTIAEAKERIGDRVDFVTIDVDDPKNEKMVEQYAISPVPTTVFCRPDGSVSSYAIGYAGVEGMVKGIGKILRN